MFFEIEQKTKIKIPPRLLDSKIDLTIKKQLIKKVVGKCSIQYGYIINLSNIISISEGIFEDHLGNCSFMIVFKCLALKLFKNEIVDAIVTKVIERGVFCELGPIKIFVNVEKIPKILRFRLCEQPFFSTESQDNIIKVDSEIRLKILTINFEENNFFANGTINEPFLGPLY